MKTRIPIECDSPIVAWIDANKGELNRPTFVANLLADARARGGAPDPLPVRVEPVERVVDVDRSIHWNDDLSPLPPGLSQPTTDDPRRAKLRQLQAVQAEAHKLQQWFVDHPAPTIYRKLSDMSVTAYAGVPWATTTPVEPPWLVAPLVDDNPHLLP